MVDGICTRLGVERAVHHGASQTTCLYLPSHRQFKVSISHNRCQGQSRTVKSVLIEANIRDEGYKNALSPFQPQSPTGLFLADLLHTNPDLISTVVEHELEVLAERKEADANQNLFSSSEPDFSLYKRIAELKSQERFDAVEEILYILIVQKFVKAQIIMVPGIHILMSSGTSWPLQFDELQSIHSNEALEMILEHSLLVLGKQAATKYFSASTFAHISKKSMKEIYTDSVTYGYFMRRLHNRFQLERVMKSWPQTARSPQEAGDRITPEVAAAMSILRDLRRSNSIPISADIRTSEFLAYILSFDAESLKQFRIIRSKEGCSIVKKHSEALFKELDLRLSSDGSIYLEGKDEAVKLNFLRSKGLVLEAIAFGSFLWDVETHVDSYYSIGNI